MDRKERKNSRRKIRIIRTIKLFGNILFFGIVGLLILYFGINTIDINTGYNFPFLGLRSSVIVSESMAYRNPDNTYLTDDMHQIQKNDVIITFNYSSYESIKLYDVLTYSSGDILVCHRVVDKYEENGLQYIVTRGDSNSADDTPFQYSLVKGKVIGVVPKIGTVVKFLQSPYVTIALFGSLFFLFLSWFIISTGNYGQYKKLSGLNKNYDEDKTFVINGELYDNAKSKKNFELIGGDNHYQITIKGDSLMLNRYIRTDYRNRIDNTIVSGEYLEKEIDETLVLSVLPLAFDLALDGLNPLSNIRQQLMDKGVMPNELKLYRAANNKIFSLINKEWCLDIDKAPKEDKRIYRKLFISYRKFRRYLKSYIGMNLEKARKMYSFLYYCLKNNYEPIDLLLKGIN